MNPKTKLKNLKYEIPGEESPRHRYNFTIITVSGFIFALVALFLIVTFAEQIDTYAEADPDNGLAIVIILIGVGLGVIAGLKRWLL